MARSWSLPVIVGAIGLAWIGFLGFEVFATPEVGRPSEPELSSALAAAATSRDEAALQSLFASRDLPSDYARDYLVQLPEGASVQAAPGRDGVGPLITLRVGAPDGVRCTSWRVTAADGRFSLVPGPALTAPCPAS